MTQPVLAQTILTFIHDLERRLVALERAPQLTNAGIRDGALTVYDSNQNPIIVLGKQADGKFGLLVNDTDGAAQLRLGQLAAGGYGGEVLDPVSSTQVKLATMAYGIQAASVATAETNTNLGVWEDLATPGPEVTVTVGASGRMLVFPAAACNVGSAGGQGFAGFAISGATTVSANVEQASMIGEAVVTAQDNPQHAATTAVLVTGLNPGVHTVTMKYYTTLQVKTFYYRTLVVIPF